jgi:hypothetical protein
MADFEMERIYIKWCFQLIERLADLERQLAEAKKLAEWTPITPENLPKEGWEVLHISPDGTFLADTVEGPNRAAWTAKRWHNAGYSFTRPIAPPQLDVITDVVLAYRPKPKSKAAKKRKRKEKKLENPDRV